MTELKVEDVLPGLEKLFVSEPKVSSRALSAQFNVPHQKIVGIIKSLQSISYVSAADRVETALELTPEGATFGENGSAEYIFWQSVPDDGISQADAQKHIPNAKIGMGKALAAKWIMKNKGKNK